MKIKKLIEILKQFDPDKEVVTSGYEFGYNDLKEDSVYELEVHLNVNNVYYGGPHEAVPSIDDLNEDERNDPEEIQDIEKTILKRNKHFKRKKVIHIGRY